MSGGRFDYLQYRFAEVADAIKQEIRNNNAAPRPEDWFEPYNFNKKTIEEFKKGVDYIEKAQIYAQRIDYLLSGDDGEDTFHERLKEDLFKYNL